MHDTTTNQIPCTPDRCCNRHEVEHTATKSDCVGECQAVCGNRPVPASRPTAAFDGRNEAITRLERLRKFYREDGDIAGASYIAAGIRALRRGAE